MKISTRPTDTKFSIYIRKKHKWTCEFCGRVCRSEDGLTIYYKCEAIHYHSRRIENTRFNEDNVRCSCFTCHIRLGGATKNENGEFDLWMKEKLGTKGYAQLKLSANTYKKRDDKADLIILNNLTIIKKK